MVKKNNEAVKIARYIHDFLNDYAPKLLTTSKHTLKSHRDALSLYIKFRESEGITPSSFTKACFERPVIERWIKWLKEIRGCSPDTCNVRLGSFRVFLEFLSSREIDFIHLIQEARLIMKQKSVKKKVSRLTRDAVSAMLLVPDLTTAAGKRDLVLMILLYATAARIDEILSLKIKHIHVSEKKESYVTIVGKGQKIRTLLLLQQAAAHLGQYINDIHGDSPDSEAYLFYSKIGGVYAKLTVAAVDKRLKVHAVSAHEKCPDVPLKFHSHLFRHARATHWLEDGINIVQISFLLGHASLQTTMQYLEVSLEEKSKALGTLEDDIGSKVEKKWKNSGQTLSAFCGVM